MATLMIGSKGTTAAPPRTSSCPRCGELWPAALSTCPLDHGELKLAEATPEPAVLEAGSRVGDYVITGKLDEGGMSTVYAATHPLIGKRVAIKIISPDLCSSADAVKRFVQEARTVNRIDHAHIIDIFTFGTLPDGRCYYVMESLQGETLATQYALGLSFEEKVSIAGQLCDALMAVHDAGVVHRDLKPENVFLVPGERGRLQVKLLDFGIALLQSGEPRGESSPMGTPQYLSPEQARGKAIDHRSDVYSLGVLAYEMFTGRLPFDAQDVQALMRMHVEAPPPDPLEADPDLPRPLGQLLLEMLAKEPHLRPALGAVRRDLRALLSKPVVIQPRQERPPRRWMRVAAGIAVAAGFAFGVGLTLRVGDSPPQTTAAPASAPPAPPAAAAAAPSPAPAVAPPKRDDAPRPAKPKKASPRKVRRESAAAPGSARADEGAAALRRRR